MRIIRIRPPKRAALVTNKSTLAAKAAFQTITVNLEGPSIRWASLEGKDYMVVPMVMITNGVHNGSSGPLLYPSEELSKTPEVWNHKPLTVYHPEINGQGVSACDPDILEQRKIGLIMNTRFVEGETKKDDTGKSWRIDRLKSEAWIDPEKCKKVDNRILESLEKKQMVEISTGLFTDNEPATGVWNGEGYTAVARNYRPDHLAILPDQKGSCSIADGAGLLRNKDGAGLDKGMSAGGIEEPGETQFDPNVVTHGHVEGLKAEHDAASSDSTTMDHHVHIPGAKHSEVKQTLKDRGFKPQGQSKDIAGTKTQVFKHNDGTKAELHSNDKGVGVRFPRPDASVVSGGTAAKDAVNPAKKGPAKNASVTSNAMSHEDIRNAIYDALDEKYGKASATYVDTVYDDCFVFSNGSKKYCQEYKVGTDGVVSFVDLPAEVTRVTQYCDSEGKVVGNAYLDDSNRVHAYGILGDTAYLRVLKPVGNAWSEEARAAAEEARKAHAGSTVEHGSNASVVRVPAGGDHAASRAAIEKHLKDEGWKAKSAKDAQGVAHKDVWQHKDKNAHVMLSSAEHSAHGDHEMAFKAGGWKGKPIKNTVGGPSVAPGSDGFELIEEVPSGLHGAIDDQAAKDQDHAFEAMATQIRHVKTQEPHTLDIAQPGTIQKGMEGTGKAKEIDRVSGSAKPKWTQNKKYRITKNKDWIAGAISKPGALRKTLGAKDGKPISAGKLAKAAEGDSKTGQRARLAITLKKMGKKKSTNNTQSPEPSVGKGSALTKNQEERVSFNKAIFIAALIGNVESPFTDDDRPWLELQDQEKLEAVGGDFVDNGIQAENEGKSYQNAGNDTGITADGKPPKLGKSKKKEQVSESGDDQNDMDDAESEVVGKGKGLDNETKLPKNKGSALSENKEVSVEDYIRKSPKPIQAVLNRALKAEATEKAKLIKVITANKRNRFTSDHLKLKDLDELAALAHLATNEEDEQGTTRSPALYFGMADGAEAPTTNEVAEEPLPSTPWDFSKAE